MFWAGIWYGGRTPLIVMNRDPTAKHRGYSAQSIIWAFEEAGEDVFNQGLLFQQDNAPIHNASTVSQWFRDRQIQTVDWPACSLDLNPIEHMWSLLKRQIHKAVPELRDEGKSEAAVAHFVSITLESWSTIKQEQIEKLIDSMPKRCQAVIEAEVWQTKY